MPKAFLHSQNYYIDPCNDYLVSHGGIKLNPESKGRMLILFTESYPYPIGAEVTFLSQELKNISNFFDKIILIPYHIGGEKSKITDGIDIEEDYALFIKRNLNSVLRILILLLQIFISRDFYKEIRDKSVWIKHPSSILSLIKDSAIAILTKKWIDIYIRKNRIELEETIFYTYWCNATTIGLCFEKKNYQNMIIVSRGHGYDLYEERHKPPYIPYRNVVLKQLNKMYVVSEYGKKYLTEHYPDFSLKYSVSRLGVDDPGFIVKNSDDEIFRIISCSNIIQVKRLDLMAHGIAELARMRPNQQFQWTHLGDGPMLKSIEDLITMISPCNLSFKFEGFISNVIQFYNNQKIDLFINTSESEGIPVTIMEAQSCGIPIIATAVGGNPEIVLGEGGRLIKANPTPKDIANEILEYFNDTVNIENKKLASKKIWEKKFNASKNFSSFAKDLLTLI